MREDAAVGVDRVAKADRLPGAADGRPQVWGPGLRSINLSRRVARDSRIFQVAIPSIKGAAIVPGAEDLRKAIDAGDLDRTHVERTLSPAALALLDETIQLALWYPVETYCELADLLIATVAHGDRQYMFRRGVENAERMIEGGLYQQLQYVDELEGAGRERLESVGRLIVTLAPAMLNFSKWSIEANSRNNDGLTIRIVEAEPFRDALLDACVGFAFTLAERAMGNLRQSCKRVSPSEIEIVYTCLD